MMVKLFLFSAVLISASLAYIIDVSKIAPRIFEETVNKSVECIRGVLNDGVPEYGIPSLNPLIIDNLTLDLSLLNIDGISGILHFEDGLATDIPSFVMTQIENEFVLIPPTWTVNFALHYDQVMADGKYLFNFTIFDQQIWGEGYILSGVENLNAAGHVVAVVLADGVHIQEFDAPITLEKYNFNITGLFGDEEYSKNVSETVSKTVPEYVNAHPEIFSDVIGPLFVAIFNALVNDDAGIGLVRDIVQKCIIDIVFPPQ